MTTKQKKVLDFMIKWAEKEIRLDSNQGLEDRHIAGLAEGGPLAMYDYGSSLFYALQEAGYSYAYVNDAAYGGEKSGCSYKVLNAIEQPFKDYFMDKYGNNK